MWQIVAYGPVGETHGRDEPDKKEGVAQIEVGLAGGIDFGYHARRLEVLSGLHNLYNVV